MQLFTFPLDANLLYAMTRDSFRQWLSKQSFFASSDMVCEYRLTEVDLGRLEHRIKGDSSQGVKGRVLVRHTSEYSAQRPMNAPHAWVDEEGMFPEYRLSFPLGVDTMLKYLSLKLREPDLGGVLAVLSVLTEASDKTRIEVISRKYLPHCMREYGDLPSVRNDLGINSLTSAMGWLLVEASLVETRSDQVASGLVN
jgi:hypothetical protein